jgi:hypothetical protein
MALFWRSWRNCASRLARLSLARQTGEVATVLANFLDVAPVSSFTAFAQRISKAETSRSGLGLTGESPFLSGFAFMEYHYVA